MATTIENLLAALESTHAPEDRAFLLAEAAIAIRHEDNELAGAWAVEAYSLADAHQDPRMKAKAALARGITEIFAIRLHDALRHLGEAKLYYSQLKDREGLAPTLRWLGLANQRLRLFATAFDYFQSANETYGQLKDYKGVGITYMNMGSCMHYLKQFDEALSFLRQAFEMRTYFDDPRDEATLWWNLGEVNFGLEHFEEAIRNFLRSLRIRRRIDDKMGQGSALFSLSRVYQRVGRVQQAIKAISSSIELAISRNYQPGLALTLTRRADCYVTAGRLDEALTDLKQAEQIQESLQQKSFNNILNKTFYKVYLALGDKDHALDYLLKYTDVVEHQAENDSLEISRNLRRSMEIEQDRRELEIIQDKNRELQLAIEENERLLLNFLPEAIAERLKAGETAIADHHKDVSVLFVDLVGFTEYSRILSPIDLLDYLNAIFVTFDEICEKHEMEKIKSIGDAYMIVGGLPIYRDDHLECMADLALDLQATTRRLSATMGENIRIRVGMDVGPVIAGIIGQQKFGFDLWGDTVNTASRMESLGESGKIHVTQAVFDRLQSTYALERRGELVVKGKGSMTTYWLSSKLGEEPLA